MKSISHKTLLPLLMIFVTLSISAQVNSSPGYMHGTYQKGDTGSKYEYDADKAKKADGADTILIRKRATPASEARADARKGQNGLGQNGQAVGDQTDTSGTPEMTTSPDDASATTTATDTTTTSNCDCASTGMITGALALLGLLCLLGLILILLLLRRRKEEEEKDKR